jgi:hypothetical protein
MKQIIFLAIIGFAAPAWSQAPAKPEPMKEAGKPEPMKEAAKPEPMKEAAKAEPMKEAAPKQAAAGPKKPRRWSEDARHCLERASNTEIIKCAEEFL